MALEVATSGGATAPLDNDGTWIDREVQELAGISDDELAALMNPADYRAEGGAVKQPVYDPDKPHNQYPKEIYEAMLAAPDEVITGASKKWAEPPQIILQTRAGWSAVSGSTDQKNALLLEKLASGSQIIGPGVYDGLSARIADASGFDVLYLSGYGVSASLLAKPDNGFLSASDMEARIKSLQVLHTPLIADADTGFGNIAKTVAAYEPLEPAVSNLKTSKCRKFAVILPGAK